MNRLLLPLLLLLSACTTFEVTERAVIRPTPDPADAPSLIDAFAELPVKAIEHRIARDDGAVLEAIWLEQLRATQTVLFFGGNLSRISSSGPAVAKLLLPMGVNVLLVDHRGSGRSTGTPHIENLFGDAVAAFDYATQRLGVPAQSVVVHGHSLGSFMAGQVARQRKLGALVLSGSATTTEDWVKSIIPWYYKPFVRTRIADNMRGRGNLDVVRNLQAPLLILVGEKDRQTPVKLSRALAAEAEAAGQAAELLIIDEAGHDDTLSRPETLRAYADFLQRVRQRG